MNDFDDKIEPAEPTKLSMAEIAMNEYARTRTSGMYHIKLEELKRKTLRQPNRTEPFPFHFTDNLEAAGDALPVYDRLIEAYLERGILPEETNEDIDYVLSQIAEAAIGEGLPSAVDGFLDYHEEYYNTVLDIVYKGNPRYKFLMAVMEIVDGLFEWKPVHSIATYKWVLNRIEIYDKYTTDYFKDCPGEDYEYLKSLKLGGDDSDENDEDSPKEPTPEPIGPKLQWRGPHNVLVDALYQLVQVTDPRSKRPMLDVTDRGLAEFLKQNFSCFSNTAVRTIEKEIEHIKKGKRPFAKKRIDLSGLRESLLND